MPTIAFGTGSKWKGQVRPSPGHALCTNLNDTRTFAEPRNQDVSAYVEQAIELGFSHLDTAQCEFRFIARLAGILT